MLEIEMKFAAGDFARLAELLGRLGAEPGGTRTDEDSYFNAPDRDFARTDEALRLRRIGARNVATYKGPKVDAATKTRVEVEVPLADGPEAAAKFAELVRHLGYRFVALVRKERRLYHLERNGFPVEVTLDEVEGVGRFVELEILAGDDARAPAVTALREIAAELQLRDGERRSYLEMLLEKSGRP